MKKILFTDHQAELGGGEIELLEIIKNINLEKFYPVVLLGATGPFYEALKREKIETIIQELPVYFRTLKRSTSISTSIFSYIRSAISMPRFTAAAAGIIKDLNAEVVYANTVKSLVYAAKAAKKCNAKLIWHLHDCLTKDFYPPGVIPRIISSSKLADKIICVSEVVKKAYLKAGGEDKNAIVIYNGVDTIRFNPDINVEDIKGSLNAKDKKIISLIGRLEEWKGQKVFIRAAESVCRKRDDVIFLIAGGPLFGCKTYEQQLKAMVKDLRMEKKIIFLGHQTNPEIIMAASDIVTHCSTKPEPFGRDIIEAMACGVPVIASNIGASPEIIENGNTGLLIDPANPNALAEAITELLKQPQQMKLFSVNARQKSVNDFGIKSITAKISDIL